MATSEFCRFLPGSSYLSRNSLVHEGTPRKSGNDPEPYAWQAPPFSEDAGVVFAKGAGAAFFSTVSIQVNDTIMGTISNPAQIGGVLSLTEITNDYATTVGASELLQTDAVQRARNTFNVTDQAGARRSAFEIVYRPPPRLPTHHEGISGCAHHVGVQRRSRIW